MAKCKHCGSSVEAMFFDRSKPDEIAAYDPKENRSYTHLEWIRKSIEEHGCCFPRRDIVLINLENDKQVYAEPSITGKPSGDAMEYLTRKEKQQAIEINRRMLETLKQYPEEWKWYFPQSERS